MYVRGRRSHCQKNRVYRGWALGELNAQVRPFGGLLAVLLILRIADRLKTLVMMTDGISGVVPCPRLHIRAQYVYVRGARIH